VTSDPADSRFDGVPSATGSPLPAFILASASPRRRALLAEAGYVFEVCLSGVDESQIPTEGLGPVQIACRLAAAKADNVARRYPDRLVLGADTLVACKGQVIGKARDAEDAARIVRLLFSGPHEVITGLALVWRDRGIEIVEAETTVVHPRPMDEAQIAEHIASGRWQDKAGAYAIQEDDAFIERVEGSFTNVVGLPMELLGRLLRRIMAER